MKRSKVSPMDVASFYLDHDCTKISHRGYMVDIVTYDMLLWRIANISGSRRFGHYICN